MNAPAAAVKPKVLIIEDEASLLTILKEECRQAGLDVLEAKDGEQGVATALAHHPDLIVLDYMLPTLNGLDVTTAIRADAWGAEAKIVMLTNVEPGDTLLARLNSARISYYLIKSNISIEELVSKMKESARG